MIAKQRAVDDFHGEVESFKRPQSHAKVARQKRLDLGGNATVDLIQLNGELKAAATAKQPDFTSEIVSRPGGIKNGLLDLRKSSPGRPVDWRWQLATRLSNGVKVPARFIDQETAKAAHFLRMYRGATEQGQEFLASLLPALFHAHELFAAVDVHMRFDVEARILAQEPFASIGRKCCLPTEAISTFESLFFNVLDRIDCPDFIINRVIGPKWHHGLEPSDIDVIWKFYGYVGGPLVLDRLIYGGLPAVRPTDPSEVAGFLRSDITSVLSSKAAIALRTLDITEPGAASRLLRTYLNLLKSDSKHQERFGRIDIRPNLQAFAEGVAFLDDASRSSDGLPVEQDDKSPVTTGELG